MGEPFTLCEQHGPYGRALTIKTQEEADAYFIVLVEWVMKERPCERKEAEEVVRHNLGYLTGYYDDETALRVQDLFKCEHPIFGKLAERGHPTPQQAFAMGQAIGEQMRERRASS